MFNQLTAWALGIGIFAIVLGIVTILLQQFSNNYGGTANTTVVFLQQSLGSTNGGLASWTPLIVTVVVGAGLISILLLAFGGEQRR